MPPKDEAPPGKILDPVEQLKFILDRQQGLQEELRCIQTKVGQSPAGRCVSLAITDSESSVHWMNDAIVHIEQNSQYASM
jgi:hypothetical protein